jgi:hypothetical protein
VLTLPRETVAQRDAPHASPAARAESGASRQSGRWHGLAP